MTTESFEVRNPQTSNRRRAQDCKRAPARLGTIPRTDLPTSSMFYGAPRRGCTCAASQEPALDARVSRVEPLRRCGDQAQTTESTTRLRLWLRADGKAADWVRVTTRCAAVKCGAVVDDLDGLEFSRCALVVTVDLGDNLRTDADA